MKDKDIRSGRKYVVGKMVSLDDTEANHRAESLYGHARNDVKEGDIVTASWWPMGLGDYFVIATLEDGQSCIFLAEEFKAAAPDELQPEEIVIKPLFAT